MPRYARVHVTGGLFHVISRFHDNRFYLDVEGARDKYLEFLGNAAATHDCRIVAYCLMSSHIHLVVQLGNDSLGTLTRKVHTPFSGWLNRQRGGRGPVFADRPKSVLVHSEMYGMELVRYVHNNPVRAGVAKRASGSDWSSHRAYLGLEPDPEWLATEAVFGPDETDREVARRELDAFVDAGRDEGRRPEFAGEVSRALTRRIRKLMGGDVSFSYPVLGPDDFVVGSLRERAARHRDRAGARTSELGAGGILARVFDELGLDVRLARRRVKLRDVVRGRRLVAWLWCERMGRPQVEIAEAMNQRASAVSKLLGTVRRDGLSTEDERVVERVLASLFRPEDEEEDTAGADEKDEEEPSPRVVVLKRLR